MASFTSHLSLHTGPATYYSRKWLTYTMSSGPHFTRSKAIVLSLKNSEGKIPLELSSKQLRFSGLDQLTRRCGSVQIPVIKAAGVEPSSAPAEEDPNFPILLYLDCFVSVAQLAVGVTLCIMNWSLGFHKRAPINKDLLTVIAPIAVFHTVVHLLFNNILNSEVVRPVSLIHKGNAPSLTSGAFCFGAILCYIWLLDFSIRLMDCYRPPFFLDILGVRCPYRYSTNVYAYVSIISLFFCIPLALHMEGPTMLYDQLSRAIAKNGMVTIFIFKNLYQYIHEADSEMKLYLTAIVDLALETRCKLEEQMTATSPVDNTTKVVVRELPYAETFGDNSNLTIPESGQSTIRNVSGLVKFVAVLITGRPVVVHPFLDTVDILVAAWLPISEGQGVTDVLLVNGDYGFTGKLARTWFKSVDELPMNVGDRRYDPLYPFGFGPTSTPTKTT
ncbi:glycosyl hydrolase family protein [Artemisia annua]|uniref:Glycosyl hydrolase family protein n=1 Tax=Artemisia annua TaxID=35608 RepID=A0A2U1NH85_ARTAN|nr:glycosyl hydrolase family protein [Artemisia annua]